MTDEPQSAADYDDRTSAAIRSVLVEIGQTLGSFRGKFAVIGGAVPWLLLKDSEMRHVGTLDIDLSLDAQALVAGDEYVALVDALRGQGYAARDTLKYFQMVRTVQPKDDGPPIDIIVDFLRPYDDVLEKNRPPLTTEFATQRASGADLAIHFHEMVAIEGDMPKGGTNKVMIAVASIPALLAMKGFALDGRYKQKDAYGANPFPGRPGYFAQSAPIGSNFWYGMAAASFWSARSCSPGNFIGPVPVTP
jgi:hypothetical protein